MAMPGCRAEYAVSWGKEFLSTPSVRRATSPARGSAGKPDISIHALREEGDFKPHKHTPKIIYISIHALREEGDLNVSGAKPTRS